MKHTGGSQNGGWGHGFENCESYDLFRHYSFEIQVTRPEMLLGPQDKGGAINMRKLLAFWLRSECFLEYRILGIITGMGPATGGDTNTLELIFSAY